MSEQNIPVEAHPLQPFLPVDARLLMLGSFPPQRKRWAMDFFYPNMQNDMWRIFGIVFFGERDHFIDSTTGLFDKERIVSFLMRQGVALYDTASEVRRLKDNASDKFLEVVRQTDIGDLLRRIPRCEAVVTTGQKATDTLCATLRCPAPQVGGCVDFDFEGRKMCFYRMPSSSRAYPLALAKKADAYKAMFDSVFG